LPRPHPFIVDREDGLAQHALDRARLGVRHMQPLPKLSRARDVWPLAQLMAEPQLLALRNAMQRCADRKMSIPMSAHAAAPRAAAAVAAREPPCKRKPEQPHARLQHCSLNVR
jgi:hypothetical protein